MTAYFNDINRPLIKAFGGGGGGRGGNIEIKTNFATQKCKLTLVEASPILSITVLSWDCLFANSDLVCYETKKDTITNL